MNKHRLVIANLKMNGSRKSVRAISQFIIQNKSRLSLVDLIFCPSDIYLERCIDDFQGIDTIQVGAQDLWSDNLFGGTGDTSAEMLVDLGVSYVIIGHSERRKVHQENDPLIAKKLESAVARGLTPILCIGETQEERIKGDTLKVLARQLKGLLNFTESVASKLIIAYEPVWAVGSSKCAPLNEVNSVIQFIKGQFRQSRREVNVVYGGSVSETNLIQLMSLQALDGVIVGRASLSGDRLMEICRLSGVEGSGNNAGKVGGAMMRMSVV
ncbi:triose-phosphate isomerase [Marinagarivorans cellulosilyticus]|uniref:Triosephosphate isomerase n=1 Tax=Marinagarivorans cellulosilyticus TaxID=2721545 RepID=A0AAN1WF51_9GAMM|nr:triose-phosphate isomerase [Marinagarivorans cellulosilyticus]BCD96473.1 triosephosphate isomerase [Marinagarivorans cellulosilyticus]